MVQISFTLALFAVVSTATTALAVSIGHAPQANAPDVNRRQSISIPPITEEQLLAGYNATCAKVNSATGSTAIEQDIANLTANSIAIQASFQSIGAQLVFIDSEHLDNRTFSPQWTNLTQQWANILWMSRDTATDTATALEEFVNVIMPNVVNLANSGQSDTAIKLIQSFENEAATLKQNAQTTSDNFVSLQQSLQDFAALFGNFANVTEGNDNTTITNLNAQIVGLQGTISELSNVLDGLALALGVTPFATAGLSLAFPLFAPAIVLAGALVAIGEAAALGVVAIELSNDRNKVNSLNAQIQTLERQLAAIEQAQATISVIQNTTIPTMVSQLNGFTNIWAAVVSDCESSIQFLNDSISGDPTVQPLIFWSTIEQVPCLYEKMVPSLQNYAIGIADSNIPQPTSDLAGFTPLETFDGDQFHLAVQAMVQKAQSSATL